MRIASILAATALTFGAAAADPKDYTITLAGNAKFNPIDPKMPKGPSVAIVHGDPKTGPVALFLKLSKGPSPIHWHTSEYWAVVIEGQTKHWLAGKDADAKPGGPGTSWYQPGGSMATAHGDECLSDSCTVYLVLSKGFDFFPAQVPAKK